jgi:FAD/FMN-containing dehydrogenase
VRRASRDENADLFWGVRGAGANLGVVTSFTFALHEVGPVVVGGLVAWPFERATEVLGAYRALTEEAPRELAVWLILLHAPPAPFVPPEWQGRKICAMAVCYSGHANGRDAALAPIRALGDPVIDLLREQPYVELQSYLDATEPKGQHYYWRTGYVTELTDEILSAMRDLFAECPIPEGDVAMLHIGGALNERAGDDGAVGNRDARFVWGVKGLWSPGEPEADAFRQWVRQGFDRLRPYATRGSYVNFQVPDEGPARTADAYGGNYARLRRIKAVYDPANLFRVNRNIPPAT